MSALRLNGVTNRKVHRNFGDTPCSEFCSSLLLQLHVFQIWEVAVMYPAISEFRIETYVINFGHILFTSMFRILFTSPLPATRNPNFDNFVTFCPILFIPLPPAIRNSNLRSCRHIHISFQFRNLELKLMS